MSRKALLAIIWGMIAWTALYAQGSSFNFEILQFEGSTTKWWKPLPHHVIPEASIFQQPEFTSWFSDMDEMVPVKKRESQEGWTHKHYQQYHGGIPVEGAIWITHAMNGTVRSANGLVAHMASLQEPQITQEDAILAVQSRMGLMPPIVREEEDFLVPKAGLIFAATSWETGGQMPEYRLAYRVEIVTLQPYSSSIAYVDAQTAEVFRIESAIQFCSAGTASTLYNGLQDIQTKYYNFPSVKFKLLDDCRGDGIHTRVDERETEANNFRYFRKCDEVWDHDNQWLGQENQPMTSLHWGAEMYFDYLQAEHGRNSLDGSGVGIKLVYHRYLLPVIVNHNTGLVGYFNPPANGYWDRIIDEGHFGCADGIRAMVSLDFVGHELTHGMIDHEMQDLLTGNNEARALNESFADILGNCSETNAIVAHVPTQAPNFTLFEDVFGGPYRSLRDPVAFGHPRAYQGTGWDFGASPDLQRNGSVQNYWFYLLANGSWGCVTEGNIGVCGIGSQNAARIVYHSITNFLGIASTFADARQASIWAAEALFGQGSFEVAQCTNAWAAVGVGNGMSICSPVEMEELKPTRKATLDISPNPASDHFQVTLHLDRKATHCQIAIWDIAGRQVDQLELAPTPSPGWYRCRVDCASLPSGNYIIAYSADQVHLCNRVSIAHQ